MQLTKQQLLQIAPSCKAPDDFLAAMNKWLPVYRIDTPVRIAAFLAQMAYESGEFNKLVENTNYTTAARLYAVFKNHFSSITEAQKYAGNPQAIANRVYANRFGNGDEASGDGYKYRGRGLVHLTFKNNYQAAKVALAGSIGDIVTSPELVERPEPAVLVACWYWSSHNLNLYADKGMSGFSDLTKAINGGLNGYDGRLDYFKLACKVMGV